MKRAILVLTLVLCALVVQTYPVYAACKFDASQKNDNFCDCPETSEDETETSACAPIGRFKCADREIYIVSSRVDDGVCDCCDGSDEQPGRCKNSCDELDRMERQRKEELAERRRAGEKAFLELAEKAKALFVKPQDKKEEVEHVSEEDLKAAEEKLDGLEAAYADENRRQRIEGLHLKLLSRDDLERILIDLAVESNTGAALESLVSAKLHCPPEKESYDESEGEEENEEEEKVEATKSDCDVVWVEGLPPASNELEEARTRTKSLREAVENQKDSGDQDANIDFGYAQVWRALKGECVSLKKEQYTYELCLFGEFKQDHVRLGKFNRWGGNFTEQIYEEGDRCFSPSVPRSVKVKIECGTTSELMDVFEPSTCVYEALFRTPAACIPDNCWDK